MWRKSLEEWLSTTSLSGFNQLYIEQLYEQYSTDPQSVDYKWRELFADLEAGALTKSRTNVEPELGHEREAAVTLVNLFRTHGHLIADVDPLKDWNRNPEYVFALSAFNLHPDDTVELAEPVFGGKKHKVSQLYDRLRQTYTGSLGFEFNHIRYENVRQWWIKNLEQTTPSIPFTEQLKILRRIVYAEQLEKVLAVKFPGAKRFSLEGNESFITLLDALVGVAADNNYLDMYLSMAHRGRLNALVNVFGLQPQELFAYFRGNAPLDQELFANDVKYHLGRNIRYRKVDSNTNPHHKWIENPQSPTIDLHLLYNPSHLEFVNGVCMGAARAKQTEYTFSRYEENEAIPACFAFTKGSDLVLPVIVHGDSALTGQGVVQEILNMSRTRAYSVGGTIHVIINNQIGFTTNNLKDMRSSTYASDVARMIDAPVIHVNGDDPLAVVRAAELAFKYRQRFKRDVFVELIGYRRHGHNEADDPKATQPQMYQLVDEHKLISDYFAQSLQQNEVISGNYLSDLRQEIFQQLANDEYLPTISGLVVEQVLPDQEGFSKAPMTASGRNFAHYSNANNLSVGKLMDLATELWTYPEDFQLAKTVDRLYQQRQANARDLEASLSWGEAELLAYASLLEKGVGVRISGEDVGRGTFSHRQATLHNTKYKDNYTPLKEMGLARGLNVGVWDSTLTETSVLGFEYGYSITDPKTLTIWEAQFGDFANVAQPIIDQFVTSGETKWDQVSGLTMLLPHGFEGAGPEHSSARIERFLQLAGNNNMRVVVPTTAGQVYHALFQQGLATDRKPLILFETKSFYRNERAFTNYQELAQHTWKPLIFDAERLVNSASKIKKLVFTNGRIRFDVEDQLAANGYFNDELFVVNVEQLYPFPETEIKQIINQLPNLELIEWVQDEPENQGSWSFVLPYFINLIKHRLGSLHLNVNSRPTSATTAVGYGAAHKQQLEAIFAQLPKLDKWMI